MNYQLRKVTKTRGHFPTEDAVLKILYLAIRNIGNNRGGELGTGTQGWKQALNALNYQLRKVTKTRGHFPTEDAVLKILYLAIRNIGNNRGGELGTGTQGWKQALNAFAITFPGRLDPTT